MKKNCFFILPALVLFLCSSAFAHSAKELPTLDQDNPLSAVCTGSGVSLRAQPSFGGEKIATLDKDEEGRLTPFKIVAYKAMAQRNFELSFNSEGDPATVTATLIKWCPRTAMCV